MKTTVAILTALLLAVALVSAIEAKSGGGCCVAYTKASSLRRLSLNVIKEYRIQEVTGLCNIPAVVLVTKQNRRICADPKAKNVKRILKLLRKKSKTPDTRRRKVKQ